LGAAPLSRDVRQADEGSAAALRLQQKKKNKTTERAATPKIPRDPAAAPKSQTVKPSANFK